MGNPPKLKIAGVPGKNVPGSEIYMQKWKERPGKIFKKDSQNFSKIGPSSFPVL